MENDMVEVGREAKYVREKLVQAEQGEFSKLTQDEILAKARSTLNSQALLHKVVSGKNDCNILNINQ